MRRVYLDNAATTPVRSEVRAAMEPYLDDRSCFGNPSSVHSYGQEAKAAMDNARDIVSEALGAGSSEITFTSGGTEADNLALVGLMLGNKHKGNHLITSSIEHEAVLQTAEFLESLGFELTVLDVDSYGQVQPEDVEAAIKENTVLVSIMHANNEIGTIQPIAEIGKITRSRGVLFHTDAVQTFGQLKVDVNELGVDALSVSSHKIYGPKGVGALYVRSGTSIQPMIHGGGQERSRRSGTENVPGIVGFAKATECMLAERDTLASTMTQLRNNFITSAYLQIPRLSLNGHPTERLPNNINVSVPGIEGEAMLLNLDLAGVAASAGSACASGSIEPSHVLTALHTTPDRVRSALRLTLGRHTTSEELDYTLDVLVKTSHRLQEMTGNNISAVV